MKKLLFAFALFATILNPARALAWGGYEESTNISIDIGPGNLVRVGNEIQYYDFSDKKMHSGEVIFMDDIFSGTRLDVRDYELKKRRVFYMERS